LYKGMKVIVAISMRPQSRTRAPSNPLETKKKKKKTRKKYSDRLICSHYFQDESSTLINKIHLWPKKANSSSE